MNQDNNTHAFGRGADPKRSGASDTDENAPDPARQASDQDLSTGPADNAGGTSQMLELEAFLPYLLATCNLSVSRAFTSRYAHPLDLSANEWRILAILGQKNRRPMAAGELGRRTRLDKVQVSRAIKRLLRYSMIERETNPADRRRSVIGLTPEGRAAYQEIVPLALERNNELLSVLSPSERTLMASLLERLRQRAEDILARHPDTPGA